MKAHSRLRAVGLALTVGLALGLGGCWDDDDDDDQSPSGSATEVPDSAGASSASFIQFIQGLASDDETSEPLLFKDSFTSPAEDDAAEPTPLT